MKTDIVIPYELNNHGIELKYALRGVEKHLSGVGDVFIVGEVPDWITNVIHIPFEQTRGNIKWKERNIFEKVLLACNDERVSEDFLFMNDDHFLLSDYEAGKFPVCWHEYLIDSIKRAYGDYKETLLNTNPDFIPNMKNYDCHCPGVIDKRLFKGLENWHDISFRKQYGYAIKSLYFQMFSQYEEHVTDLKIKEHLNFIQLLKLTETRDWFSISDNAIRHEPMITLLNHYYPNKSKYER